jgi:hypothetical protein
VTRRDASDRSRGALACALWVAVIVTALLLPVATTLLAGPDGSASSGAGLSAEESSAALNGVSRLLHAAVSLRVEPMAAVEPCLLPSASPAAALDAATRCDASPCDRVPFAVSESRLL